MLGLAAASAMQTVDVSTTNFQTFAELAFRFVLTPTIAWQALAFALAMGRGGRLHPRLAGGAAADRGLPAGGVNASASQAGWHG